MPLLSSMFSRNKEEAKETRDVEVKEASVPPFRVGKVQGLREKLPLRIKDANRGTLCLVPSGDGFRAVEDACPHKRAKLSSGEIEDIGGELMIRCPKHRRKFHGGLYFNPVTGRGWCQDSATCSHFDPSWRLAVYATRVDARGELWIEGGDIGRQSEELLQRDGSSRQHRTVGEEFSPWVVNEITVAGESSFIFRLSAVTVPGQWVRAADPSSWHVSLRGPRSKEVEREYTPLSSAREWTEGRIVLLIKVYQTGALTSRLGETQIGERWWMSDPHTTVDVPRQILPAAGRGLGIALFAGGTGVAPCWQLVQSARAMFGGRLEAAVRTSILCSYSTFSQALLAPDFEELSRSSNGQVAVGFTVTQSTAPLGWMKGRVTLAVVDAVLQKAGGDREALRCVVSGPEGFNATVSAFLKEAGVPPAHVVVLDA